MIKPPYDLRCEYLFNPICIDIRKPRFSWLLTHEERNQTQ
ncbi:MAG: glycoside hydrolase family 78 protein, partial [Promethearchaeota archaeon]